MKSLYCCLGNKSINQQEYIFSSMSDIKIILEPQNIKLKWNSIWFQWDSCRGDNIYTNKNINNFYNLAFEKCVQNEYKVLLREKRTGIRKMFL